MGFGKCFEDNLEIYNERMAMRECAIKQEQRIAASTAKAATTQNRQKERDDFSAMLAGESCFLR